MSHVAFPQYSHLPWEQVDEILRESGYLLDTFLKTMDEEYGYSQLRPSSSSSDTKSLTPPPLSSERVRSLSVSPVSSVDDGSPPQVDLSSVEDNKWGNQQPQPSGFTSDQKSLTPPELSPVRNGSPDGSSGDSALDSLTPSDLTPEREKSPDSIRVAASDHSDFSMHLSAKGKHDNVKEAMVTTVLASAMPTISYQVERAIYNAMLKLEVSSGCSFSAIVSVVQIAAEHLQNGIKLLREIETGAVFLYSTEAMVIFLRKEVFPENHTTDKDAEFTNRLASVMPDISYEAERAIYHAVLEKEIELFKERDALIGRINSENERIRDLQEEVLKPMSLQEILGLESDLSKLKEELNDLKRELSEKERNDKFSRLLTCVQYAAERLQDPKLLLEAVKSGDIFNVT